MLQHMRNLRDAELQSLNSKESSLGLSFLLPDLDLRGAELQLGPLRPLQPSASRLAASLPSPFGAA